MPDSSGNTEQIRIVAEQVADAAIIRFASRHPEMVKQPAEIPPPLKWAGIVLASILSIAASGGFIWLVTTVYVMQVTLARMDERMSGGDTAQLARDAEQDRRILKNEGAIAELTGKGGAR